MTFLEHSEGTIRLAAFAGIFVLMAVLETVFPRRQRTQALGRRWLTNFGLVVLDTLTLRVVMPILAMGAAAIATEKGWGLFNLLDMPVVIEIFLAVIVFDMLIYLQHILSHHVPIIWRFHKVHHADRDIDVTTGARFHPIEIVFSMALKIFFVILLGPAVVAVFLFEIILNTSAMFNHSNVRIPPAFDRLLRVFIVTPDMHRVHHSVYREETNSNFGFFLSLWDRLFRTYRGQPKDGHDGMTIGLAEHQTKSPNRLLWSLLLPFRAPAKFEAQESSNSKGPS